MSKWLTLALLLQGCFASYQSTARLYAEQGRHELAVFYWAGHFRSQADKPNAKADLVLGMQNALQSLDHEWERQTKMGHMQAALGTATRREALIAFARSQGLYEFEAIDAGSLTQQSLRQAAKKSLQRLDVAEAAEKPIKTLTRLSRIALALDPHNPELAVRYERLRLGQVTDLLARHQCDNLHRAMCQRFVGLLLSDLTQERREFTHLVSNQAGHHNTELVVRLTQQRSDGKWGRIRSGKAEKEIEDKNRFKEIRRDSNGDKQTRTVRARFEVFEKTAKAKVGVHVQVRDLRPPGRLIVDTRTQRTESDKRTYLTWKGDERALGKLMGLGTNQTSPKKSAVLAHKAMGWLAKSLSKQILAQLEGANR